MACRQYVLHHPQQGALAAAPVAEQHDDELFGPRHSAAAGVEQRGDKLLRFAGRIEGEQAPLLRRLVEGRSTGIREEVGLHAKLAGLAATPHYRTGE